MVVILGLAATSGGVGDNKLLLWNVSTGELVSDLNAVHRLVICNEPAQLYNIGCLHLLCSLLECSLRICSLKLDFSMYSL